MKRILRPLLAALAPALLLAGSAQAQALNFDGCGFLVPGVTCTTLFQADAGGLYIIGNTGGFANGDYVHVNGVIDPTCITTCQQGNGCIFSNTIMLCVPNVIGTNYCGPAVVNSTSLPGFIEATGSDLVIDNDVTLTGRQLPNGQFGYFLTGMTSGFIPLPPGSMGNLCITGNIGRYNAQVAQITGGELSISINLQSMPVNPNVAVVAGDTWHFTLWYRDQNPAATSNFTDATSITFQ